MAPNSEYAQSRGKTKPAQTYAAKGPETLPAAAAPPRRGRQPQRRRSAGRPVLGRARLLARSLRPQLQAERRLRPGSGTRARIRLPTS